MKSTKKNTAILLVCGALSLTIGAKRKEPTPESIEQARSHRFEPVIRKIEGWTVHVEPKLLEGDHGDVGTRALEMLTNHLQRIAILVPAEQLVKLRTIELWIEHAHPQLGGMHYHPNPKWLTDRGHDRRLAKKVHITHAEQLLSRQQMLKHPAVILHELAHAYHDQFLSFDNRRIIDAYDKAMAAGLYEKVLLYTGRQVRHYGASNHKEYFAEGTESFFYRNDFYPFVAAELKEYDPTLHDLLTEIWGPLK
ncbi:MAG: M90 metallopeptidase family protein [Planctomycetota bacterium]|jgi:dipeptidyl-peptidase-4